MIRRLPAVLVLTAVYALMLASADPADLLVGAGLSAALVGAFGDVLPGRGVLPTRRLAGRAPAAVALLAIVLRDIVVGTWRVTLTVLGLRSARSGTVVIDVSDRSHAGTLAEALLVSVTPGEIAVDIDLAEGRLVVHVLDAGDPDAVRAAHAELYRRQRRVLP
jgi:multicomponent Na+:H+ antiporter subunit E